MSEQTITRSQFLLLAEDPAVLPIMQLALQDGRLKVEEDAHE